MAQLSELDAIKIAERQHYERCFAMLSVAMTLQHLFCSPRNTEDASYFESVPARWDWMEDKAMRSVNRWRSHFAPDRVGLPLDEFVYAPQVV